MQGDVPRNPMLVLLGRAWSRDHHFKAGVKFREKMTRLTTVSVRERGKEGERKRERKGEREGEKEGERERELQRG